MGGMRFAVLGVTGSALFALLLIGLSCRPADSPDDGKDGSAVSFEMRRFERTAGNCAAGKDDPCASFLAEYPEITVAAGAEIARALNDEIRAMLLAPALGAAEPGGLEMMAGAFLGQWQETRSEFPEAASTQNWFIEHRIRVIYQDGGLISVESAEETYMGGAHPNASTRYASFTLDDGHHLVLADLFKPGSDTRMNEIAEGVFRKAREISEDQTLTDAGFWFQDDRFALNDNFAVVDKGLLFYFNSYEVGPYSAGPTKIVISLDQLGDLILPDNPLDRSP